VVYKNVITLHYLIADLEAKKHKFGCEFYVRGEFLKYIKDFKIINERIHYLRLRATRFSCTLINVHVTTYEKMEEVKEKFYNLLEQNINQIANSDIKILLRDFNTKVGKEDIYKPTTGNETLHTETNNRIKMIQFTVSKGFNVRTTIFSRKDIHKEKWYSADSRMANQIDHVLISNRFRSAVTDNKELRGPDIGSNHNLLKINCKMKLRVKTEKKYNWKRKIVNIFQNSKWKQEYAIELNNRFKILEYMEDEENTDNNITENGKTLRQ